MPLSGLMAIPWTMLKCPWPGMVAEPLVDELAVLVQMQHARGADVVGRRFVGVVGTLVRVTLADIDVAIRSESEVQRLPEQPLSLGFIPVAALPLHADRHQELSLGTEFHHRVAVLVADPDVVLRVDGHAVRLVLMADHVLADGANQLVILVELEQLRFSGGVALKGEQVAFELMATADDTAVALRAKRTDTRR